MDEFQSSLGHVDDEPDADELRAEMQAALEPDQRLTERLKIIDAYRASAPDDPGPKIVGLKAMTADLMEAGFLVSEVMRRAHLDGGLMLDDFQPDSPAVKQLIQVSKVTAQLVQAEINSCKLESLRTAGGPLTPKLPR
jgi:hypothetical protein